MATDREKSNHQGNQSVTSPKPASTQFFTTLELLSLTLSHLPPLQILLLQRTSKTFLGAVESSLPIQRTLFFEPDPRKTDFHKIEANPFLGRFKTPWHHFLIAGMDGIRAWGCDGEVEIADVKRFGHPDASWRRMLVSMPVVERVAIGRYDTSIHWGRHVELKNGGGVRMWQIADHVWQDEGDLNDLVWLRLKA